MKNIILTLLSFFRAVIFIFYCIVVWSNGCGDKNIHYDLLIESFYDVPKTAFYYFTYTFF